MIVWNKTEYLLFKLEELDSSFFYLLLLYVQYVHTQSNQPDLQKQNIIELAVATMRKSAR